MPRMPAMNASSDPRVTDLVRAGRLRAALFLPQYRKDAATGELHGVWVDMVRALGAHIGLAVEIVELSTPAEMLGCLASGGCDVGSLGFDPERASQVGGFTAPFMQVDYTYLVPAGSAIRSIADADRAAIRIAAVRRHASTLALARMLRHAAPVSADSPDEAFELLRSGRVDAWASIRPALGDACRRLPGALVLAESYGANRPALVVPNGHTARLAAISEFVVAAKASGLLRQIIDRAGQPGYAPAD